MEIGGLFSEGEIAMVVSGVMENFRMDGRSCYDIRKRHINTGIISSCNGSAQISSKNCNIIVGVKAEVVRPTEEEPECGIIEINADCPMLEGRGGGEEIAQEIITVLSNALIPPIDRSSLCISQGHKVWAIYVDILILECGISQIVDLSARAVKAALYDTRVPKLIADEEDANDFVVSDDEEYCPFETCDIPNLITLTRIHDQYVADVTEEEAAAGIARLTLAFDSKSQLVYSKKSGCGSLHPEPMKDIVAKIANEDFDFVKNPFNHK